MSWKWLDTWKTMTLRTFTDKNGNEWSWNETPEVLKVLKNFHAGNYEGPLYAPHPDLKQTKDE